MQLSVKGKQIDIGAALKSHIESSLENTVDKYFENPQEGSVVISKEGQSFRSDISLHVGRGILLQSHALSDDPYVSFDNALARLAKQLRRYKSRLRNHHTDKSEREVLAAQYTVLSGKNDEPQEEDTGAESAPVIVAETTSEISTLTVGEAVMRMDLADLPALMFRNRGSGNINMIYRRTDGNVGWVDPRESAPSGA